MSSTQTHFLLLSNRRRARPFFILYLKTVNNTALTASFMFLSVFPASPIAISSTSCLSAASFPFYVGQTLGLAILSVVWDRDSVSQPWGVGGTVLWHQCRRGQSCLCSWDLPVLDIPGQVGWWVGGNLPLLPQTQVDVHPNKTASQLLFFTYVPSWKF